MVNEEIIPGQEGIYSGEYILHWEVPGLRIKSGRRFLGLFDIWEGWSVIFPDDFTWPDNAADPEKLIASDGGGKYHLIAKGIPSKKGQFGHLGSFTREFEVSEVIELKKK